MARGQKNPAFGRWVQKWRGNSGKTQTDLAQEAKLPQQLLSRIETQGVVPNDEELRKLCDALGRPVAEAVGIITGGDIEQNIRLYETRFQRFRSMLSAMSLRPGLEVFMIREDRTPVHEAAVKIHLDILAETRDMRLNLLFRHAGDERVWGSFQQLALLLAKAWKKDHGDINVLRRRFLGYYRHPEIEERPARALPMAHPYVLVVDAGVPQLFYYDVDPDTYRHQRDAGYDLAAAQQQSVSLVSGWNEPANLINGWIGSHDESGLDEKRWVRIAWPSIDDASD